MCAVHCFGSFLNAPLTQKQCSQGIKPTLQGGPWVKYEVLVLILTGFM